MRISKLVTLAAGLIVSLPLSAWEADAAPFPLPLLVEASDIVLAQMPVDDGPEMMWHGFRGVREPRPGYRRHSNGWWYPIGAFAAGSLLGMGAAFDRPPPHPDEAPPPSPRAVWFDPEHYTWCAQKYRSYRAYDNTFQPHKGPRRQCHSPFVD
ncbi:BA14K family protein [Neorhizobium sp. Rsf11]|uniref:Lectin-like protein BA14k n=1 Tax=Neorhizobium phenanthreniclasticum TaxID=3157917 RepID=A0ABV0M6B5_9HYPH